jgi:hypothetical protein
MPIRPFLSGQAFDPETRPGSALRVFNDPLCDQTGGGIVPLRDRRRRVPAEAAMNSRLRAWGTSLTADSFINDCNALRIPQCPSALRINPGIVNGVKRLTASSVPRWSEIGRWRARLSAKPHRENATQRLRRLKRSPIKCGDCSDLGEQIRQSQSGRFGS